MPTYHNALRTAAELRYREAVKKLIPDINDPRDQARVAAVLCRLTGLQPSEFKAMRVEDRLNFVKEALNLQEDSTADTEDGIPPTDKGVSMLDAALILTDEDEKLAREKKTAWQKSREPKPAELGRCRNHAQVKLYAPSALSDFVEKVEGVDLSRKYKLRQRLSRKARPFRTR